jgi:hypothetical protein
MLAGHSGYLCPFQMNTAQRGSDKPHHSRGYLGVRICRSGALSLRCGASIKDRTLSDLGAREPNLTQAYIARRTAEGKTIREIKRCLKRYITRELYRTLTATMTPTTNNPAAA